MILPQQAAPVSRGVAGAAMAQEGVRSSFCTPCVLGKRICGLPFRPKVKSCGDQTTFGCRRVGPCLPFIKKQLRCCIFPPGCKLVSC